MKVFKCFDGCRGILLLSFITLASFLLALGSDMSNIESLVEKNDKLAIKLALRLQNKTSQLIHTLYQSKPIQPCVLHNILYEPENPSLNLGHLVLRANNIFSLLCEERLFHIFNIAEAGYFLKTFNHVGEEVLSSALNLADKTSAEFNVTGAVIAKLILAYGSKNRPISREEINIITGIPLRGIKIKIGEDRDKFCKYTKKSDIDLFQNVYGKGYYINPDHVAILQYDVEPAKGVQASLHSFYTALNWLKKLLAPSPILHSTKLAKEIASSLAPAHFKIINELADEKYSLTKEKIVPFSAFGTLLDMEDISKVRNNMKSHVNLINKKVRAIEKEDLFRIANIKDEGYYLLYLNPNGKQVVEEILKLAKS